MNQLTLHVFSCGHGDTLLLGMPGPKWALIDCHLPKKNGARDRFFKYVDSLGINRLDYVVLTHSDRDHYLGMRQVLDHFAAKDHGLGYFCAATESHVHVVKLLESRGVPADEIKEYVELFKTVTQYKKEGKLQRHALHDQVAFSGIKGRWYKISLAAIGPSYNELATASDQALVGATDSPLDSNECSAVLVVKFSTRFTSRQILLPGDMEGDGMAKALGCWDAHRDNAKRGRGFDVVKAPHHGSKNGHDGQLPRRIAKRNKSALLISCGDKYDLPNRAVVSDYIGHGWRVYCTSPRHSAPVPRSTFQVMHQRRSMGAERHDLAKYNLVVTFGGWGGFSVSPSDARIHGEQLERYT